MPCIWLLTIALTATSSAGQEIANPPAPSASTRARPQESKNPFARRFQNTPGDPAAKPKSAPLFRTGPVRRSIGTKDEAPLDGESVEIICGMSVARKSAQIDRGIALPANRGANIAVRRIEPDTCGASRRP
jgi:hypothetical protein